MDLSKGNFFQFVDHYAEITGASTSTAGNVRSVCQLVRDFIPAGVSADSWDTKKIIDDYVSLNGIAGDTHKSYISRFNSAVSKFIAAEKGENVTVKQRRSPVKSTPNLPPLPQYPSVKTFELPIPLREELIVMVSNLPRNLTKEEAKRISTIIESFAVSQPTPEFE